MAIKRVYKNTMIGSQFLLKNGKSIKFPQGRYETDSPTEIAELDAEIESGIPHLYIDPADSTVDTTLQDMIQEAQRDAMLKVMASYKAASKPQEIGEVKELPNKKDPQGGDFVAGASDAQVASRVSGANLTADSAAVEVKPNQNLAHLLANKTSTTGVTSSANVNPAAAGSAS